MINRSQSEKIRINKFQLLNFLQNGNEYTPFKDYLVSPSFKPGIQTTKNTYQPILPTSKFQTSGFAPFKNERNQMGYLISSTHCAQDESQSKSKLDGKFFLNKLSYNLVKDLRNQTLKERQVKMRARMTIKKEAETKELVRQSVISKINFLDPNNQCNKLNSSSQPALSQKNKLYKTQSLFNCKIQNEYDLNMRTASTIAGSQQNITQPQEQLSNKPFNLHIRSCDTFKTEYGNFKNKLMPLPSPKHNTLDSSQNSLSRNDGESNSDYIDDPNEPKGQLRFRLNQQKITRTNKDHLTPSPKVIQPKKRLFISQKSLIPPLGLYSPQYNLLYKRVQNCVFKQQPEKNLADPQYISEARSNILMDMPSVSQSKEILTKNKMGCNQQFENYERLYAKTISEVKKINNNANTNNNCKYIEKAKEDQFRSNGVLLRPYNNQLSLKLVVNDCNEFYEVSQYIKSKVLYHKTYLQQQKRNKNM